MALAAAAFVAVWFASRDRRLPNDEPAARPTRPEPRSDDGLARMLGELMRTPVTPTGKGDESQAASSNEKPAQTPHDPELPPPQLVLGPDREPNLVRVSGLRGEFVEGAWPNGARKFHAHQRQWRNGVWVLEGEWRAWYPNGEMEELGGYLDDVEHGPWSWWYASGAPMARGRFDEGLRVGWWTFWHPNGVVIGEGEYVDGERTGRWTFRYPNGSLHADYSGVYEEGERVGP